MYFCDNDVVPGCPVPEDVEWLSADNIIQQIIEIEEKENGNSDLKG